MYREKTSEGTPNPDTWPMWRGGVVLGAAPPGDTESGHVADVAGAVGVGPGHRGQHGDAHVVLAYGGSLDRKLGGTVSATRLLVLGVVRMHGRAHGYQVRRDLLTWSADKWANVAPGSIYHALKKMAREKLLEEVHEGGEARGPDRTAYQLTPD